MTRARVLAISVQEQSVQTPSAGKSCSRNSVLNPTAAGGCGMQVCAGNYNGDPVSTTSDVAFIGAGPYGLPMRSDNQPLSITAGLVDARIAT